VTRLAPVLRREYVERVRSKAFLISTVLGPLIMAGLVLVPALVMKKQGARTLRVTIVDGTGSLYARIEEALARRKSAGQPRFAVSMARPGTPEATPEELRSAVLTGRIDGYLVLPPDILATSRLEYHGKNVSNMEDIRYLNEAVTESLMASRLAAQGLATEQVRALTRKVDMRTIRLSAGGSREDRGQAVVAAFLLTMMLYSAILLWGAAIMNGVLEEKTNRVVEVIASSIPPTTFFAGKLLGVGAAGLTQFLVWGVSLLAVGAYASLAGGGNAFPEMPPLVAVSFVVYFILGFFLYGTMYAAAGSAVNTQQEAQSLSIPLMMPLPLSLMFAPAILNSPDSTLSVVLSLVPLFTPLIMMLRIIALTPPWWQIALSVVLMLATIAGINAAAARIYRVGILMYGKRPTLPEILRWVRQS
jgi:ABC-2 type transport system permease protein